MADEEYTDPTPPVPPPPPGSPGQPESPESMRPPPEAGSGFGSPADYPASVTPEERTWATLSHALTLLGYLVGFGGFIAPLVIWLVKKEESEYIGDQAKEALNFQITVFLAMLASGFLTCVIIGWPLLLAVIVTDVVLVIIAATQANQGVRYRYPWTLRLIA